MSKVRQTSLGQVNDDDDNDDNDDNNDGNIKQQAMMQHVSLYNSKVSSNGGYNNSQKSQTFSTTLSPAN